jgi:hypothetical protein
MPEINFTYGDADNNKYSDNQTLELFRFLRAIHLASIEKIFEALENPNCNLTDVEREFWLKQANEIHCITETYHESINNLIAFLDNRKKSENAHLN